MIISAKRAAEKSGFDRSVKRLLDKEDVTDADLVRVVKGIFCGEYWISIHDYGLAQRRVHKCKPGSRAAQAAVDKLRSRPYQDYLAAVRARRAAKALTITYKVDHIPKTTSNNRRPGESMSAKYLTIHSTGNPSSKASGERSWLTNSQNNRTASFHIVVDESQAVECIPLDEIAWHAGDGNGDGNKKSISLEICESGDRSKTLHNAVVLAAKILRDRDIDTSFLRRHHDWATKLCPRILIVPENRQRPSQTWEWFTAEVEALL